MQIKVERKGLVRFSCWFRRVYLYVLNVSVLVFGYDKKRKKEND